MPHAVEHLCLTDPILDFGRIDGILFSGGVGEYVYGRETRDFGDMGRRLGRAIRARVDAGKLPWPLLPAHRMHPRHRARVRRNTQSSCPATPAIFPIRGRCCRGGICRWCSRRSSAKR